MGCSTGFRLRKPPMVPGIARKVDAKITGRTPLMFTLMGMKELWPPYILRPTTRLAYWTGMRRSALFIKTMKAISKRKTMPVRGTHSHIMPPVLNISLPRRSTEEGTRETIPAKRMREMPLPMPFSSMRSPSQTTSMAPAVKAAMMVTAARAPEAPEV